jgi:RimJ/RimL family protein N-acetyltransferase
VFERWAQDAALLRYLNWRPHGTLRQTEAQLNWDMACWGKRSRWTWLLLPHGEAAPVGQVELTPQAGGEPPHHLHLGYLLARSHQGQGLMREAVAAVQAHALAQPAVWRVDALCDVDNLASQRLLQALGWACEGRLARHSHHPLAGPTPRDVLLYAVVRA